MFHLLSPSTSFLYKSIVTRNGKTWTELAVLRTYVENQATQEPSPFYRASKCKQTKEQASEDCLWTHNLTFLCDYCQLFFFFLSRCRQNRIKLCYNRLQFVKKKNKNKHCIKHSGDANYVDHKFFFNILLGATCTKTWVQTSKYHKAA